MDGTNCLDCAHCTYIHEYECYICEKALRGAFKDIVTDPVACSDFERYLEEE